MVQNSHNYEKQRIKVARYHEKIVNQRKDWLHKLSYYFAETYDYVFVDSAAGSDSFHGILAKVCDRAIVVVTGDPVCVRSADAAVGRVLKADKDIDIRMIINRFDRYEVEMGKQMKLDDVIDSARVQLIGVIPEDDSVRLLSNGSKISKYAFNAFLRTAKRILGENVLFKQKDFY